MLDLNERLQPINSPIANNQGAVSSYEFDSSNERNTVDLTKIKNFNFSSGTGGTLALGGAANGNGLMVVRDASGSTIVTVNNSGVTITGGNISIADSSGTSIIDSQGIVSTGAFQSWFAENLTANLDNTGTTFVNLANSTTSTYVFTRTTRVLFNLMGYGYNSNIVSNASGFPNLELAIYDSNGGTTFSNVVIRGIPADYNTWFYDGNGTVYNQSEFHWIGAQMIGRSNIKEIAAGTHTFNLQWRARVTGTTGWGTAHLDAWSFSVLVLGK